MLLVSFWFKRWLHSHYFDVYFNWFVLLICFIVLRKSDIMRRFEIIYMSLCFWIFVRYIDVVCWCVCMQSIEYIALYHFFTSHTIHYITTCFFTLSFFSLLFYFFALHFIHILIHLRRSRFTQQFVFQIVLASDISMSLHLIRGLTKESVVLRKNLWPYERTRGHAK